MALYALGDRSPVVAPDAWIADSAEVIGEVEIGQGCFVGPCAVIRADFGAIRIGAGSIVEDGCVLHVPPELLMEIGRRVTIGHGAVVHAERIGDDAVIGMGAVVSWGVTIGEFAIVGEGCVVPRGMTVPAGKLVVGVPAAIKRDVTEEDRSLWTWGKRLYAELARDMRAKLRRIG